MNNRKKYAKHGLSYHRLYSVWRGMKDRCYNKNNRRYEHYGGRGINVCDEWLEDFLNFYNWAYKNGYNEKEEYGKCTLDRINNDGNYEPTNCRWITLQEQNYNTSRTHYIEYNGKEYPIKMLAQILDIPYRTLNNAINGRKYPNGNYQAPKTIYEFLKEYKPRPQTRKKKV